MHMKDWAMGSDGKWVSMGVPAVGDYGVCRKPRERWEMAQRVHAHPLVLRHARLCGAPVHQSARTSAADASSRRPAAAVTGMGEGFFFSVPVVCSPGAYKRVGGVTMTPEVRARPPSAATS